MVRSSTLRPMSALALSNLSLRRAGPTDDALLRCLAELDSTRSLQQPVLLAEHDGVAVAALSVADGRVAVDPFRPTAAASSTSPPARSAPRSGTTTRASPRRSGAPWTPSCT